LHTPALTPNSLTQEFPRLGRYQLLSRLAVGGMAEVYLARQGELSGFKTLVVVKKVLPHLAVNPDFIAMFLDEARIASMLDHPNVVRITEVGRADDEYFLVMELVQGKPLASLLQHAEKAKTPLPHQMGALIVANAAAGLHHAHQLTDASGEPLGLVHRDVSPQNIMVSFEGSVKVIDFGIARALGRLGDTNAGSLKGKLGYMAPEQARGEAVDARADIFSLGVVLWECLTGRRLFLRENELATLRAVVYEPIPPLAKFTRVPSALESITKLALARNLNERFQTAEEMRIALEQWVFSSGGTSTHELSALMKGWFPKDFAQWQRAARIALDMQETDGPIDVAFPDLAASRSGHSRTGTSRPKTAGSGPRLRWESTSRMLKSQTVPLAGEPVPDLRPKARRFVFPAVVALGLVAAFAAGAWYWRNKSMLGAANAPSPQVEAASSGRPRIETIPSVVTPPGSGANPSGAPQGPSAPSPHVGDTNRPQDREASPQPTQHAAQEAAVLKKKNRTTSAEKRAILRQSDDAEHAARPDTTSSHDFNNGSSDGRNKKIRPNPF
jgi:serine/threonine-protein kinase